MALSGQQLFKFEEVCQMLALSEGSVRKLIKDKHLAPGHKVPGQRGVRWFRIDIETFLDALRKAPTADPDEENLS